MSDTVKMIILGLLLFSISTFLFEGGLIMTFFDVTEYATNPTHIRGMAFDPQSGQADFTVIFAFIIDLAIFLLIAAALVFSFNLFSKKAKQ